MAVAFDKPPYNGRRVDENAVPNRCEDMKTPSSTPPLTAPEIEHALMHLPGWKWERDALVKTLKFVNFREALAFMLRAGFEADTLNHHPEWTNTYNKLVIRLTTHDSGDKVTSKDVALAMKIQALCGE